MGIWYLVSLNPRGFALGLWDIPHAHLYLKQYFSWSILFSDLTGLAISTSKKRQEH